MPIADTTQQTADGPLDRPGSLLAGRYRVLDWLARGGQADVYTGVDTQADSPVAVKFVPLRSTEAAERFEREVRVLRLLDDPGVVRLFATGVTGGQGWIVMERVEGVPFPGGRARWEELAPVVHALLETLDRVHGRGFIHRDLKPGNVLVGPSGTPTLLDFGLARGDGVTTLTASGAFMGTPRYMAPEQLRSERADERTDLYQVGVMVREALTGEPCFGGTELSDMLARRTRASLPSIAARVPELSPQVVGVLDALVAPRSEDRPRSARVALLALTGSVRDTEFPWLGGRSVVESVIGRLRAGETVRVSGRAGSGRSRLVREVAAVFAEEGRPRMHAAPATVPLGSLVPLVGPPEGDPLRWAERRLQSRLSAGELLLVDDAERLDRWSREVLDRVSGSVLRIEPDADITLPPLDEADLRVLFHGPESLLHLPSDAAALLWRRSRGNPARVAGEVDRWVAAGLASWVEGRIRVDRAALERLQAGFPGVPPAADGDAPLRPELEDLLAWIHIAGPGLDRRGLAEARGEPRWQLDLALDELQRGGAIACEGEGVEPLVPARALAQWDAERRLAAHTAIAAAMPPLAPGRLGHLLALGESRAAVEEAVRVADQQAAGGRMGAALETSRQAAELALRSAEPAAALWKRLAQLALEDGSRSCIASTAALVRRATDAGEAGALLDAACAPTLEPAATWLRDLAPLADVDLELRRHDLRVRTSRAAGGAAYGATVEAASSWAEGVRTAQALAARAWWRASWHYHGNRQREAAEEAESGLTEELLPSMRLRLVLRALSTWLELGEPARVRHLAQALRADGARLRLPQMEGYGVWAERSLLNRTRQAEGVDEPLLEAARALRGDALSGLILVTEATICAWRGEVERGGALALEAGLAFEAAASPASAAWAGAVTWFCTPDPAHMERTVKALAEVNRSDILAEGLALLATRLPLSEPQRLLFDGAWHATHWGEAKDWRRGYFSPNEMLEAVNQGPRGAATTV